MPPSLGSLYPGKTKFFSGLKIYPEQHLLLLLLLFIHCLLLRLLFVGWGVVLRPCFVLQYAVCFLVLQLSRLDRESWLLYFRCVLNVNVMSLLS